MEELYQKGMELWETAEQLIKQHKIASSEGRSEMVSYQKQAVECWQTAAEQGNAKAQHQLGEVWRLPQVYLEIDIVKANPEITKRRFIGTPERWSWVSRGLWSIELDGAMKNSEISAMP